MAPGDVESIDWYFCRSLLVSRNHRNLVSAYLVGRCHGSKVVARIEPLGFVHKKISDHEMALYGLHRSLVVAGPWRTTSSRHHALVRVEPVRGSSK
jgi:hypothetical protein